MATIILDFDGTIADSFDYVATFLKRQVRNANPLTDHEKHELRGMTMQQMAEHLGCPKWALPWLFVVGRHAMGKAMYNVPMFEGMGRVIEKLHAEGHQLIIVSSNNNRNIRKFLKHHHIYSFFTDQYGDAGFFGKKRAIERVLKRNHVARSATWYVGDEARDIIAAHAAGVRAIAATWGFDHADVLASHEPAAIANQPEDILRILEEL